MALVYFLLSFVFLLYIKKVEKSFFVPSSLIVLTWGIFPGIYCLGPMNFYPLVPYTHLVVLLSLITFFTFYYVFHYSHKVRYGNNVAVVSSSHDVNYKLLIALNLAVIVWMIPIMLESWATLLVIGMAQQRTIGFETLGTINVTIYEVFAKPLIVASLAILSLDLFRQGGNNRMRLILLLLVVVNIFLETIVFAARATTMKIVYFMFFSYLFIFRHGMSKKKKRTFVAIIAIVFVAILFVTSLRNVDLDEGGSVLETMLIYYCSSFGLLNYYIIHPSFSLLTPEHMTYGTCIIGFIYNVIQSGMTVVFGTKYGGTDNIITQVTQEPVPISPEISTNAMFTADYCFLKDFGLPGVIIGFVICAFFIIKFRNFFFRKPSVRSGALYVFFLYITFRLSVCYDFLFPSALFTLIYIWIGTRASKKQKATREQKYEIAETFPRR